MLTVNDLYLQIGESSILNGISLKIEEGETVGIIGPNGSGKTTFFNCISGFVSPQRGSIIFGGREISTLRPFQRAKLGIGRVFQSFGIFREMTVQENLITAMEGKASLLATFLPWSRTSRTIRKEALEYLRRIGLEGKAEDKAASLSGGQMRLLEIIRTLAFEAELFLLDEPTAGVSPKMKGDVGRLIREVQEAKKTVLIIEHDINFIKEFCDRIVVLDGGRVALDDTPENIGKSTVLQEIYFGTPRSAA